MVQKADVLLVTATPVESRAVIDAFARISSQPTRPVPLQDRIYHDLGEVGKIGVFLALSEMGAGGLGSSLQTVQKAIEALRPTAVILVGTAFGVNEQKQGIGDVLASRQLLLYEPQRLGERKIIMRGDKPHASPRLINYFESARLHWKEPTVTVRFGLILSGEKLVDNLDYREQLKQFEAEAIGGEMEGAGLYAACQDAKVDWILIKAICDWADGRKAQNQGARQQLAARNAAAFVVHALRHAPWSKSDSPKDDRNNTEAILLKKCLERLFDKDEDLRDFCFEYYPEVYRNLRELDRLSHIIREIITFCKTRGTTDVLWNLLKQRNPTITEKFKR